MVNNKDSLLEFVAKIVSSYVANNALETAELPRLIQQVHQSLSILEQGDVIPEISPTLTPSVPIKKSVKPDHIVCLDCGKPQTMLKRHLGTAHGLTPDEYRTRWSLPSDYPMVAPRYAERRSELAKKIGLGRMRSRPAASDAE
ncbi:MAG: MucR family transcriptional regulator [Alphaproteobacteria bacterium]|nr:MucR family transcriptional regulator [Alphaproteobacteria bacterium]